MKNQHIAILLLLAIGCSEENITNEPLGSISVQTSINNETNEINFNGRIETGLADLSVNILDENDLVVESFEDASQLPNEIELTPGVYRVEASNNEVDIVAFDAASYFGQSDLFEVVSAETQNVDVQVSIANVKMTVNFTSSVTDNFTDYRVTATSTDGGLTFDKNETRSGFFSVGKDIEVVALIGSLSATTTLSAPNAADHYIINVSYIPANGSAGISITIDDSTNDINLDLDVAPTIWSGTSLTFSKANGADPALEANQDRISDFVWLTRGNNGGQIYNAKTESSASKPTSPDGTLWAIGTTANLADLTFDNFRNTIRPKNAVDVDLVLHLTEENVFLDITFQSWASGRQGGFSYTRSTE